MKELIELGIGGLFLILGIPIGNFISKVTKEEFKHRKAIFNLIVPICLLGGFISMIYENDIMLFTLFFIAIVGGRCLKK